MPEDTGGGPMRLAEMTRRGRRGAMTREIAYQKVLLAVYVLAEEDGLACYTFNTGIARECGVSPAAVGRAVAEMERRGVIRTFDWRDGLNCRMIVLMDHPEGRSFARQTRRECGPRRK
jgi:hypothetical protein